MKEQSKFSGTICYISSSPHGEVDGIVLDDGGFIKLPPHSVLEPKKIKVGTQVNGSGERLNLKPNSVYHHVIVRSEDVVLADDQGEHHDKKRLQKVRVSKIVGKLVAIGTKPKGEVDRMILDDGTSVHLSKDFELFADDMLIGRKYEVEGEVRSFENLKFCKAESVSVAT
jgi:hypothetical protein